MIDKTKCEDLVCPYCKNIYKMTVFDIAYNHDAFKLDKYNSRCGECDKNFIYEIEIKFTLNTKKAKCLNGFNHLFKEEKISNFSGNFTFLYCDVCGLRVDKDKWKKLNEKI